MPATPQYHLLEVQEQLEKQMMYYARGRAAGNRRSNFELAKSAEWRGPCQLQYPPQAGPSS